ncbi:MAG TPA: ribosome recycling factor [Myxococcota bacterium]|nr:ribosome recycling factor [Myxococcota bacterium]
MADESSDLVISEAKDAMQKSIAGFTHDLAKIRTGRANPALLEGLQVDYYGTPTPIKKLAQLNAPEARLITIQPFDRSAIAEIEKAIHKANLGVSPVSDGKIVRVPIPELTEERRKELVKQVKKLGEEHKIGVRNARRDAMTMVKDFQKDGDLAEDVAHQVSEKIQKLTDDYTAQIDKAVEAKESELMKV